MYEHNQIYPFDGTRNHTDKLIHFSESKCAVDIGIHFKIDLYDEYTCNGLHIYTCTYRTCNTQQHTLATAMVGSILFLRGVGALLY